MHAKLTVQMALAVAIAATSFASFGQRAPSHVAPFVPFEEVFAAEDTLILDPEVLIGQIWSLDIDDAGRMVLVDYVAQAIHLFSATGSHVAQLATENCWPEPVTPWNARFVSNGRIVAKGTSGTFFAFDSAGMCIVAKRAPELRTVTGFCGMVDSTFAIRSMAPRGPILLVLSPDFEIEREIPLEEPRFRRLTVQALSQPGRNIGCFETGPRYLYPESADGVPVWLPDVPQSIPEFYEDRSRDVSLDTDQMKRVTEIMDATIAYGIYELDDSAHIVSYLGRRKARFQNLEGRGFQIVDRAHPASAVSTIADINVLAAKDGLVYALQAHQRQPDGTLNNPGIIRYRYLRK